MTKLSAPRVKITVEDGDLYKEYDVQTDNRDFVRWDMTRSRNSWPTAQEASFLWMTFLAWSAMSRTGETPLKFEDFQNVTVAVEPVDENGEVISDAQATAGTSVGGYDADSRVYLICELAVEMGVAPSVLMEESTEIICTLLDVMERRAEAAKKK